MDWRDLALKAAEQINDENWGQGQWWVGNVSYSNTSRSVYDNVQPTQACAVGHLYWVAKDQGLSFDETRDLVSRIEGHAARLFITEPRPVALIIAAPTTDHNDAPGRTAGEVSERLRLIATS